MAAVDAVGIGDASHPTDQVVLVADGLTVSADRCKFVAVGISIFSHSSVGVAARCQSVAVIKAVGQGFAAWT